jgi:hypothetical protein
MVLASMTLKTFNGMWVCQSRENTFKSHEYELLEVRSTIMFIQVLIDIYQWLIYNRMQDPNL